MGIVIAGKRGAGIAKKPECLPLAALCLLFAACASLPVLPVPRDENDTLLVLTTGQHMDANAAYLYVLELKIDTMDKPVIIRPWEKYAIVSGLTPGEHLTTTLTVVPYSSDPSWYSTESRKPKPSPFTVPFVMKPGGCTIFPIKFIYIMKVDAGMGKGRVGWDPQELTAEERQKEAEGMKILKNFSLWKSD